MRVLSRVLGFALYCALVIAAGSFAASQDRPGTSAGPVTFHGLVQLLRTGQSEQEILALLEKSPLDVGFVLGDGQVAELKKMRVSDEFLDGVQKLLKNRTTSLASDVTDLVLILDCSGSMSDKIKDGQTKMEAAKKVVTELIRDFPAGRRLGLVVYGHDRNRECQAVDVVRPLGALDDSARKQLIEYVDRLQPSGHTPIARALEAATGEIANAKGLSRVVLITDGMESCHGDPVQAAADLVAKTKSTVDVIGFNLKPEETKAINQIAKAGRGKYYDAQTAERLRQDLRQVAKLTPQPAKTPSPPRARTEDQLAVFTGHEKSVLSVGFSRDGQSVASAGGEKEGFTARRWDANSGKSLDEAPLALRFAQRVIISPDGRRVLCAPIQTVLELWDVGTRRNILKVDVATPHKHSLAFSPNGRRFILGYQSIPGDALVAVWDAETGKQVQVFKEHKKLVKVHSVALSPDGRTAASADGEDGVRLWEVESGKQIQQVKRPGVLCMAFSPDGKFLVTGEALDVAILWDRSAGEEMRRFEGHTGGVPAVCFSPDSKYLVTGGEDKSVRLWDVGAGNELHRFDGHTAEVTSVAFSSDGKQAISGGKDMTARVWNIAKYTAAPR